MAEQTIFNSPETPAPLFAYRALRGVFFGSPDDNDKENATVDTRYPTDDKKDKSPLSSFSSKRRRLQLSSPAKSILRTPGIPTPRKRAGISVSFKDVRKSESVSPELKMKINTARRNSKDKDKQVNAMVAKNAGECAGPSSIASIVPLMPRSLQDQPHTTGFNIDAYMHATEKEVKKLIQYGQKMRDYARKQDKDNAELRKIVDVLKRENERLRNNQAQRPDAINVPAVQVKPTVPEQPRRTLPTPQDMAKIADIGGKPASAPENRGTDSPRTKRSLEVDATSPTQANSADVEQFDDKRGVGVRQSSARLPPDRLAAARERIRFKAEQRKAMENSQVDWAIL